MLKLRHANRDNAVWLCAPRLAHTAMNQHHAAHDCYKKALELDPGNESYKNNLQLAEQKIQEEKVGSIAV